MAEKKVECWHFIREDRKLGYGCGLEVAPGYTYIEDGPIEICASGLHGSRTAYQALSYAPGPVLSRVRIWGDITEHDDKLVGRNREVLEVLDVSIELRLWGCWCIRNTPITGVRTVWDLLTDERSRKAVETAEAFAIGNASNKQLAAAWDAAWDVAWDAARDATWDAARDAAMDAALAAATDAALAAATDAAWAAAWAATWDAARAAAWDAARDATWDAARDAARAAASKFQAEELERRMLKLFGIKARKVA